MKLEGKNMTESKYGKYIISDPKIVNIAYHPSSKKVEGVTFPDEIFLDNELVEGSPMIIDIGWRFEVPDPDPVEWTHSHDFDEALCFIGTDHEKPHDLGGEIEFHIGDEIHTFDTTTVIYVPKNLPHCPFMHKRVDRPFLLVVFGLTGRYPTTEEDAKISPDKY
jgi:hypothetical protein